MSQHQIVYVQKYLSQLMFIIEKFFVLFFHSSKMQRRLFKILVSSFQLLNTQNQKIFNTLNLILIYHMSNEIFYFNEQHCITFIQQSKKSNINQVSNRCSISSQYRMQMLKSHFNFIIRQLRQRINNKLMFSLHHIICHRMIRRNNLNLDSISL